MYALIKSKILTKKKGIVFFFFLDIEGLHVCTSLLAEKSKTSYMITYVGHDFRNAKGENSVQMSQ